MLLPKTDLTLENHIKAVERFNKINCNSSLHPNRYGRLRRDDNTTLIISLVEF